MSHKNYTRTPWPRRIFFWVLALSFFIVAGTVLFYTLGYRYNRDHGIFIYAGSFNVKSQPRNLTATIDGEIPTNRHLNFINDSYHITGIRPGTHTLRFTAPDYKPWEKETKIRSGIATEFWNVILVRTNYERTGYNIQNPIALFFAPRDDLLAYPLKSANTNALRIPIFDLKNDVITTLLTIPDAQFIDNPKENIEWSPDATSMIVPIERFAPVPEPVIPSRDTVDGMTEDHVADDSMLTTTSSTTSVTPPTTKSPTQENAVTNDTAREEDAEPFPPVKDYVIITDTAGDKPTQRYISQIVSLIPPVTPAPSDSSVETTSSTTSLQQKTTQVMAEDTTLDATDQQNEDTVPPTIRMLRWHPYMQNVLYALVDDTLMTFDLTKEPSDNGYTTTIATDIRAYDFADDGIYLLNKAGILHHSSDYAAPQTEALTQMIDDQADDRYRLIAYDKDRVVAINDTTGKLTIYNAFENDKKVTTEDGIQDARFSNDGKKLMFHSDHDITVYFTRPWHDQPIRNANTTRVIAHFDDPITAVEWTPDYEHVLASVEHLMYLVELDPRGSNLVTDVFSREVTDRNVIMDHGENKLYFTDKLSDSTTQLFSVYFPQEKQGLFR